MTDSLTTRILNFDGSVVAQKGLIERLGTPDVVDLTELGPRVRYLPSNESAQRLVAALEPLESAFLTFTGSGDFHHATPLLLGKLPEPVSVVIFDHHSDWIGSSPCPCGAWILDALKIENVRKIVSIGMGESSIRKWRVNHGPVKELFGGRVEFYPYDCALSRCLGRHSGSPGCAEVSRGLFTTDIRWKTVAQSDWHELIARISRNLPTESVYITIDKDCLRREHGVSNWEEGNLTLEQLTKAVGIIRAEKRVIGADITGEFSPIVVENRMFEKMALKIHPKQPEPTDAELAENEATNIALVNALAG